MVFSCLHFFTCVFLVLSSECVKRVFLFIFFYLSSSTEKERSSSSSATHVVSVRALHNPQHTNINCYQQKTSTVSYGQLLKVAATREKSHSTSMKNTYQCKCEYLKTVIKHKNSPTIIKICCFFIQKQILLKKKKTGLKEEETVMAQHRRHTFLL